MSFTTEQIEKIAHLARLGMTKEDIQQYTHKLSSILDLMQQLEAIDTTNIKPMAHPYETPQRFRPDVVTETNQREKLQKIAPQVIAGLYIVPQVIE